MLTDSYCINIELIQKEKEACGPPFEILSKKIKN